VSKSPLARLDFAFQMYQEHFGLARLLDPEDVHLESVDKQSVMTYIMCIYQVMPHDSEEKSLVVRKLAFCRSAFTTKKYLYKFPFTYRIK